MAATSRASLFFMNYGSFPGSTVMYTNVSESSDTDAMALFGSPTVSGDSIDFTPIEFAATSLLHVPPVDHTDGHLTFGVMANTNKSIQNISFDEGGGLTVGGFGTDATFVDVSAFGNIDVFEVDGQGISKLTIPIWLTFSFGNNGTSDNGTWTLDSQGFVNDAWTGGQAIDIAGYLHTHGYPNANGATKIEVALDNKLYAQSEIESHGEHRQEGLRRAERDGQFGERSGTERRGPGSAWLWSACSLDADPPADESILPHG